MLDQRIKSIHFIGIGGYGMSALATVMLELGYHVSGCDIKSSRRTEQLQLRGATIFLQHHPQHLENCDLAVYSTAIPTHNQELLEAARQRILWHRSQLLAFLLNNSNSIAVTGTHGKTTTTAMLSLLLEQGGLDPTAIIGGEVPHYQGNGRLGKSGYLVAEACESDNSFLRYQPYYAVVTNIEPEHLENFDDDFSQLKDAYRTFLQNIRQEGAAILNAEDEYLIQLSKDLPVKTWTYALEDTPGAENARFLAKNIQHYLRGSSFLLYEGSKRWGTVKLSVPGRHNISNALAALSATRLLGLNPIRIAEVLTSFTGVGRRFEILGETKGVTVIDDYAHHPTEIITTLETAYKSCEVRNNHDNKDTNQNPAQRRGKIIAIFQPHRYSRTSYFLQEFSRSFSYADVILLHSVYSAGENPIKGVNTSHLMEKIKQQEKGKPVHFLEDMNRLTELAVSYSAPGDIIITLGAGDIWKAAQSALRMLEATPTTQTTSEQ